jgi:protease-4
MVRAWRDHGPYISSDAVDAGLVDRVVYEDELPSAMRASLGYGYRAIGQSSFRDRAYENNQWGPRSHVAVVFAEGVIAEGVDAETGFMGKTLGGKTVGRAIRKAREDRRVDAIVLRVNSGGGSVFASDEIWREMARTVGVKPVIVSFGDVAASGGYYIATTADSIFALPGTVTGSIGVIYGKVVLDELYDKIGLDKDVLTRGEFADMFGTTAPFDSTERAVVRSLIDHAYDHFVELVAEGRDLSVDSVDAIAQGRVWSGTAATRLGLVDRDADLWESIQTAARMAGIGPGESVDVDVLPRPGWELFQYNWLGGVMAHADAVPGLDGLRGLLAYTGIVGDGFAYALPFTVQIW